MQKYFLLPLLLGLAFPAWADDTAPKEVTVINKVQGGVEGINNDTFSGGDGTGSALVRLRVIQLQLNKQGYGLTAEGKMENKRLAQDAKVVLGQVIYFTLFVDNLTDAELYDVAMQDQLDETAFAYIPGSLEMATTSAKVEAQDKDFTTRLTDDIDADIAHITEASDVQPGKDLVRVGRSSGSNNGILSIAPGKRLTVRFKVQVQ
jgi:hypothetical protein